MNGSTSTTAINNSGNTFSNNNIYDYFGAAVSSSGIYISSGNTDNIITGNNFYQTATRTQTTASQHSSIWIANTSGNNTLISANKIGFATYPSATGTGSATAGTGSGKYTFVGIASSVFVPVFLNVGSTTATSVQGNTISDIAISGAMSGTTSTTSVRLVYIADGLVSIGNVTGNTFGSMSGTGNITYTSSSSSATDFNCVYNFGNFAFITNNNSIGGISVTNSSTGAANFYGLRCNTVAAVTFVATGNTIGGTVANSISTTSTSTSNIVNAINNASPIGTFTGNTIRNITTNAGTGTGSSASLAGIVMISTANNIVSQNSIFNLSNTNTSAASTVTGIHFNGSTVNTVDRNNIYGLTAATNSATAEVTGIRVAGGTTTYKNNMITIGDGIANAVQINGINEPSGTGTDNFYHNSIYIGGAPTAGTGNSFAFSSLTTVTRAFRDNIFVNARNNGGATGKNYIVRVGGTTANPSGLTINNNIYFGSGTGNVFGFFNSLDVADLTAWKTAVGQDANSFSSNPQFLAPTASTPDLHINPAIATAAEGNGAAIAGVTDDFDGQTRSGLTPTDIGADAGNFTGLDLIWTSYHLYQSG
ncbi:beta strand repeat-containing protein [Flavobacterium sp. 3HN19-14]|uniref:beta strand repeat-containing protein n=1 Tax=Flavobacterium sp. 3HN19-14 TaxID=3448133 RepID=UPI003EE22781